MKNNNKIYNRTNDLRKRLNEFLSKLTGSKKEYYDTLTQEQLIDLKIALSDVNNVLTLKTTLSFAEWIYKYFKLTKEEYNRLIDQINSKKPNANGYDIKLETDKIKIIAEIKCIIPINKGKKYGAAQRNSILDDALKLENGTKEIPNTSNYIKLIGLIDLGDITDSAIEDLKTPVKKIRTTNERTKKRNEIVKKIVEIKKNTAMQDLNTTNIYIKKLKFNNIKTITLPTKR